MVSSNPRDNTQKPGTVRTITPPKKFGDKETVREKTGSSFKRTNLPEKERQGAIDRNLETQRAKQELALKQAREEAKPKIITPEIQAEQFPKQVNQISPFKKLTPSQVLRNRLIGFQSGLIRGFKDPAVIQAEDVVVNSQDVGESIGATSRAALEILPFGKSKKVLETVNKGAKAVSSVFPTNKAGKVASFLTGKVGLDILAATKGQEALISSEEFKRLSVEEERLIKSSSGKAAIGKGFKAQSQKEFEKSFVRGLAFETTPFIESKEGKTAFDTAVRESLKLQGFTPKEIETGVRAARKSKQIRGGVEAGLLVFTEGTSEFFGTGAVSRTLVSLPKKTTVKDIQSSLVKTGIPTLAVSGASEGAVFEFGSQQIRQKDIDKADIVIAGVIGSVAAPALGVPIQVLSVSEKATSRGVGKGLEAFGQILDFPGEALGDVSSKVAVTVGRSVDPDFFQIPRVRTKKPTGGASAVLESEGSDTKLVRQTDKNLAEIIGGARPSKSKKPTPSPSIVTQFLSQTPGSRGNGKAKTPTPGSRGNGKAKTPTPGSPPAPTPKITSNTPQPSNLAQTPTTTNSFFSPISVPQVTSDFGGLPFFPPPGGPIGFGGGASAKGKRKTFIDELAIAQNILGNNLRAENKALNSFLGEKPSKSKSKNKSKKKGKKKKKSKKTDQGPLGGFNDFAFRGFI